LIETIEDAKGTLTIIMVGHPKLGNDLNRPAMEEIGARAKLFSLDSWGQQKQRYIEWVLEQCSKPKTPIHDIVAPDAINLLAKRLITSLQICHYLTLAIIKGATTGTKPVDVEIIEAVYHLM
jgi:type II secretory pathway predicted ATPase ExeA